MDKLFLDALEVAECLGEGKTVFNGPTGSRNDPRFPEPIRRPGRKDKWYRPHIEAYARDVADEFKAAPRLADPPRPSPGRTHTRPLEPPAMKRGRGRPPKHSQQSYVGA